MIQDIEAGTFGNAYRGSSLETVVGSIAEQRYENRDHQRLTGSKVKLGLWDHYLTMREGILALNARHRDLLSNDLGALAGLLFDVGTARYPAPPLGGGHASRQWGRKLSR